MKRKLLLTMVLVACLLTATVGGTIAWFTDTVETSAIHINGGECEINNTEIRVINNTVYGQSVQYEHLFGVGMNGGTLTMNNSKITFDGLGGYGETLYLPFPLMTNAQKTLNISNTVFEGATAYAMNIGSNAVINTTDAPEAWAGKTSGVTVNFIQP